MAPFDDRGVNRALFAVFVALVLAACDTQADVPEACANLCDCTVAGPSREAQCVAQCVALLDQQAVPQACLDCVAFSSCDELGAENPCPAECGGPPSNLESNP